MSYIKISKAFCMKKIIIILALALVCFNAGILPAAEPQATPIVHGAVFTATDGQAYTAAEINMLNEGLEARYNVTGAPFSGVREYFENYSLIQVKPYVNGKLHGIMQGYYPTGQILHDVPFINGAINGTVKNYHANGVISRTTPFVNGKTEGLAKIYNEQGRIIKEISYVNGVIEGECKRFDAVANTWTINVYKNGVKVSSKQ